MQQKNSSNVIVGNFGRKQNGILSRGINVVKNKIAHVIDNGLQDSKSLIYRINERLSFRIARLIRSIEVSSISGDTIKLCDILTNYLDTKESLMKSDHFDGERYATYTEELKLGKRTIEGELICIDNHEQEEPEGGFSISEKVLFLNLLFKASFLKKTMIEKRGLVEWLKKDLDMLIETLEETPQLSTSLQTAYQLSSLLDNITRRGLNNISRDYIQRLEDLAIRIKM